LLKVRTHSLANYYSISGRAEVFFFSFHLTAAMSTTPTGLVRILLASSGNFLLPIVLSTAQLAISRQWPDSDIPQNLEQVKVIVNVIGASVTSLVAALNRWHLSRITSMLAVTEAEAEAEAMAETMARQVATETTALLGSPSGAHLKRRTSKERQAGIKSDAEPLIDIDLAEDQTQGFATLLPITYPLGSFPDPGFYFSCVDVYDKLL
jgi:hypothetical protein